METTQHRLRYKRSPFERGTLEFEVDYVRKMCYIAGHKLGLPDDSLAIEEAYTKYILQILNGERKKISIKTITFEIMHNITRKLSCYFSDLPEYYEPVAEDTLEAENNPYTLAICKKLEELRGEKNYENALQYYRTVGNTLGNNQYNPYSKGRDIERERKGAVIRSRTSKLKQKLKKMKH